MSDAGGTPRSTDVDSTTTRLLEAAAAAFVEHGYDGASVSDIARRAGLTTGAIYARWPRKDDMMADAVEHTLEQFLPARRLKELGIDHLPAFQIISAWTALLLGPDPTQEVLVQAFASARYNEEVRERLRTYLNVRGDQIYQLIERAKDEAAEDRGFSTVALTLLFQAVAVGTILVLSTGLDERHIPQPDEWADLNNALLDAAFPRQQQAE